MNHAQVANFNFTLPTIPLGIGAWILFIIIGNSFDLLELTYVHQLLLAAPLFLIPMVWKMETVPAWTRYFGLPAALSLTIGYWLSPGNLAALFTLPWLMAVSVLAGEQFVAFIFKNKHDISEYCKMAGYLFLPVGAAWSFADRWGLNVFGFDPTITLLTAVHFHYAGFLLPMLTAYVLSGWNHSLRHWLGYGIMAGIPLVAIGISASQFSWPAPVEVVAVTIMAGSAFTVGFLQARLGWRYINRHGWMSCLTVRQHRPGGLWLLSGLALMMGMTLAMAYGWRYYFPVEMLTVPWMYAVHGTLNAIGFALPGVVGWSLYSNTEI